MNEQTYIAKFWSQTYYFIELSMTTDENRLKAMFKLMETNNTNYSLGLITMSLHDQVHTMILSGIKLIKSSMND